MTKLEVGIPANKLSLYVFFFVIIRDFLFVL